VVSTGIEMNFVIYTLRVLFEMGTAVNMIKYGKECLYGIVSETLLALVECCNEIRRM
jgi:hypothetical protein